MSTPKKRIAQLVALTGLVTMAFATLIAPAMAAVSITGAGATFPAPLYSKWSADYYSKTAKKVKVNYQSIGSGGGIAAIKAGTVLFGGSDAPLTAADLKKFSLVQFPTCVGGVVPIVNLTGVGSGKLKLTGTILAQIYMGKITKWNAASIKALNPGVSLPSTKIYPVHRSDSSGTTWIFTHYLSAVNGDWAKKVGASTSVHWPIGTGEKGSELVAAQVKRLKGSIGYVEYAYSQQARIPWAKLRNRSNAYVSPTLASFKAAAGSAKWSAGNGFGTIFVNASGKSSWPIAGASFVIVKKSTGNYTNAHTMFQFFDWAYKNATGKSDAGKLRYVSMPSGVISAVEKVWHAQVKAGGKAAW
jgi:phosphate transport system substrate-binding protein